MDIEGQGIHRHRRRLGPRRRHGAHARRAGAKVVIADLQADKGAAVAAEIGGALRHAATSARKPTASAWSPRRSALGKLIGLVNCAGIAPGGADGRQGGRARARRCSAKVDHGQPDRQLQHDPPRGRGDGQERARADRRARRADLDRERRRLRRPDRPGRLFGVEGRHRRHDACRSRATSRADGIRNMTIAPGIFGTPMLFTMPEGSAAGARRQRAVPEPPRHAGRLRQARAADRHERHAQRRGDPPRRRDPPRAEVADVARSGPSGAGPSLAEGGERSREGAVLFSAARGAKRGAATPRLSSRRAPRGAPGRRCRRCPARS